jgi:hypothetical protein
MALDLLRKSESEACHHMIRTFHDQFRYTLSKFKNVVPKNGWNLSLYRREQMKISCHRSKHHFLDTMSQKARKLMQTDRSRIYPEQDLRTCAWKFFGFSNQSMVL